MIDAIVDFKSIWFIIYVLIIVGQYEIWYQMLFQLLQKVSEFRKKLYFVTFILLHILGVIFQIQCIRTQVIYDFGFLISVAYSTIFFYASIFLFIGFSIRTFKKEFMSKRQLFSMVPWMHSFFLTQLSFSFANSSPCGILLSFIYLYKTFFSKSLFYKKWRIVVKKEE